MGKRRLCGAHQTLWNVILSVKVEQWGLEAWRVCYLSEGGDGRAEEGRTGGRSKSLVSVLKALIRPAIVCGEGSGACMRFVELVAYFSTACPGLWVSEGERLLEPGYRRHSLNFQ